MKRTLTSRPAWGRDGAGLLAAALVLAGCAPLAATERPARPEAAALPLPVDVPGALAGATEPQAKFLPLPPVDNWPRLLSAKGPVYAMVGLEPYVGQMGVLSDYKRADAGMGFGLVAGYRRPMGAANVLGLELVYESSSHDCEASGVGAKATRLLAASRFSMKMDEKLAPFAVAGGGLYKLKFDGLDPRYNLSGMGLMAGGGVDYSPRPALTLRAELDLHVWAAAEEGSGNGGTAETLTLVLGAAVSF